MNQLAFGLSAAAPCSYLASEQEQLVFVLPQTPVSSTLYQQLLDLNFRRSGEQVYRPHCPACSACQSVRLNPTQLRPSRSQRRLVKKAMLANVRYCLTDVASPAYFPLFRSYIAYKHADGAMYPATEEQLDSLIKCSWLNVKFLEQYVDNKLVAVTIVDCVERSYSAVYTFYSDTISQFSPGTLAILFLVQLACEQNKQWVYLGYRVSGCQKMAYKAAFMPQQRFIQGQWHSFG